MAESLKVLLVEDDPNDAELIVRALTRAGYDVQWTRVATADAVANALAAPGWEIILTDHAMAGFDSQQTLALVRDLAPNTPVVLVSGAIGEERAVDEMRHGAADYVSKDNLERLEPVVRRTLKETAERAELAQAKREREASDTQLRALFDHALDAIIIVGDDRRILDANPAMSRLAGRERDGLVGLHTNDLLVPGKPGVVDARWTELLQTGEQHGELGILHVSGAIRHVDFVAVAHFLPSRHMVALRDMTERKAAEHALARRHAQQAALASLSRAALVPGSSEDLQRKAVATVRSVLGSDRAGVIELLDEGRAFRVSAITGDGDAAADIGHAAQTDPAIALAVAAQGPIIVGDWEREQRFPAPRSARELGERSAVGVPIEGRDARFGFVFATSKAPDRFGENEADFLAAVAWTLSWAIQRREIEADIRHQSLHDALTGLPNRTLFLDRVAHALARTDRDRQPLAVLFIDLDHFKLVNDSLGHAAGDDLLRLIAPRLQSAIRQSDTLARLGGDEFAVLCEQLPSRLAAIGVAKQLIAALEKPVALHGDDRVVSASIGIALSTGSAGAAELLRDADAAMYHAKTAGRGRFELFDDDMRARVLGRVRTESALRTALARDVEVHLAYQPLVSLRSGQIVGAEALARWRHPGQGFVQPGDFIPVAEESGLIHELGAKLLQRAVIECAGWRDHGEFAGVAINVSTRQLVRHDEVAGVIRQALAAADIPAGFLTVELTESVLIEQLDAARKALKSLRDLGVRLSLDDFGTGYSSLSYLSHLPFDGVKIDRSLITNIVAKPQADALAAAIIRMGHALDLRVVAEGVETAEQAARLKMLGCDIAQGFYFAKPMEPRRFAALLHDRPMWSCGDAENAHSGLISLGP